MQSETELPNGSVIGIDESVPVTQPDQEEEREEKEEKVSKTTTTFECERCHYTTHKCWNMKLHLSKKYPCHPKFSSKTMKEVRDEFFKQYSGLPTGGGEDDAHVLQFPCIYCNKSYMNKFNLKRHIQSFHKSQYDQENQDIKEKYAIVTRREQEELKNSVAEVPSTETPILFAFGFEYVEMIDPNVMNAWIQNMTSFRLIREIMEDIYFSPDNPQNHNFRLKDPVRKYYEIFDGTKWKVVLEKQAIHQLIMRLFEILFTLIRDTRFCLQGLQEQTIVHPIHFTQSYVNDFILRSIGEILLHFRVDVDEMQSQIDDFIVKTDKVLDFIETMKYKNYRHVHYSRLFKCLVEYFHQRYIRDMEANQ